MLAELSMELAETLHKQLCMAEACWGGFVGPGFVEGPSQTVC
jgi:hypothetical protein